MDSKNGSKRLRTTVVGFILVDCKCTPEGRTLCQLSVCLLYCFISFVHFTPSPCLSSPLPLRLVMEDWVVTTPPPYPLPLWSAIESCGVGRGRGLGRGERGAAVSPPRAPWETSLNDGPPCSRSVTPNLCWSKLEDAFISGTMSQRAIQFKPTHFKRELKNTFYNCRL